MLGLKQYYPRRITLQDVTKIRETKPCVSAEQLPWDILLGIIMMDYRTRDQLVDDFNSKVHELNSSESLGMTLNPQDVFLATFHCCSLLLRQVLFEKMFNCKLAVPIFVPHQGKTEMSLWSMRTFQFGLFAIIQLSSFEKVIHLGQIIFILTHRRLW